MARAVHELILTAMAAFGGTPMRQEKGANHVGPKDQAVVRHSFADVYA